MLERFHCLSVLFFKEKSVFLSSFFSPSLRCPEIATRARSSLIRKYDLCASFLCFHSFFRPSVPALVINSFIVRVLFLARHTLINEFFLFRLSFLARTLAILHFAITATTLFFFFFFHPRASSLPLIPFFFSRQSRTVTDNPPLFKARFSLSSHSLAIPFRSRAFRSSPVTLFAHE